MLYICATPIGNLKDLSFRAVEILSLADIILCEDTRVSRVLFNAHGIKYTTLIALHEHNEAELSQQVITWLSEGKNIVQISDAGTPAISDPGARLCDKVLKAGFQISPIPGACAYVSLMSVSGVNVPHLFYGFLPNTKNKRIKVLLQWKDSNFAVAIYESPHRIVDSVSDMLECFGKERLMVIGRELTKQFETIKKAKIGEILEFIKSDSNQQRGEFVVIILPNEHDSPKSQLTSECINTVMLLSKELPPKKVATIASQIHNVDKNLLYNYLVENNTSNQK